MHFQVHASFQWGGFTLTVHQRVIHYEEPLIKINSHEQESTIHHHQNAINKAQNLRRIGLTWLPASEIQSPKSSPQNPVPEIRSPKFGPRNSVPEIQSPKPGPRKEEGNVKWRQKVEVQICSMNKSQFPDSKIQSPKPGPWNPVPKKGR